MAACPACGHENREGRKFCTQCGMALALACPSCGATSEPGERFCGECGTAFATVAPTAQGSVSATIAPAAERRLVSVLFVDLVGFTSASEDRDAEDTRELLSRYFDMARTIIERYGGTVEKFIGDAVMAVWGTPPATEDDAERAVRAALELVDAVPQLDTSLLARAGVSTGEAAVTIGAEGQGMVAGDLVNTASRIQSEAEPGAVLVGEATRRASVAAVAYEEVGEFELKGKTEPAVLHRAVRVVASRGGEGRSSGLEAPFVGRDRELRLVKDLFHSTADDLRATLVSVIGVAGVGKSRLSWEFEKYLDGLAATVWWHRGRCLSYGEGVAFWALAEMIRSRAGIVDAEDETTAQGKLRASVEEHVADPQDREWVLPRLEHLLGLAEHSGFERDDLFSGWRLFFEHLSAMRPVVLVFEDTHWADAGLIAFIEHLLDWSRAKPIFVLALSRPELNERHPGFPGAVRNTTTLTLEPLSNDDMDALLGGLVPGLPEDTRSAIRERADGIPLYAVETVRMLIDRGLVAQDGDRYRVVGDVSTVAVPETLHALIAARLDGLERDERRLLELAAVLGKTFTVAELAALGGTDATALEPLLIRLVRKEVLELDADPRSPERGRYGFLQALVQRVAYETLSRRDRRSLHLAAAAYLAESATDPDEIAEVIAAHYRDAHAADSDADDSARLATQSREWLVRAGERAAALAAPDEARRSFDEAARLTDDPLTQARLLERAGELAYEAGELDRSVEHLERARELYAAAGAADLAARSAGSLSRSLMVLGRTDEAVALAGSALEILSAGEADEHVARLAAQLARAEWSGDKFDAAMEHVEQALVIAESETLPDVLSHALNTKALLYWSRPHESRALLREALAVALAHDLVDAALRSYNNLVARLENDDRLDEAKRLTAEGLRLAQQRGYRHAVTQFGFETCFEAFEDGRWDDAFLLASELLPEGPTVEFAAARGVLAYVAFERGDEAEMRHQLNLVSAEVATSSDLQVSLVYGWTQAFKAVAEGRTDDALTGCQRYIEDTLEKLAQPEWASYWGLALATRALQIAGVSMSPLAKLVASVDTVPIGHRSRRFTASLSPVRGLLAAETGDMDAAIDAFSVALAAARSLGEKPLLARVLADYGVSLSGAGRSGEAEPLLDEAQELWERMGAVRWLERIEAARERTEMPA